MFYSFNQNNSGGSFDEDVAKGIGYYVIIEANSADEANTKAEKIGLYFDGCYNDLDCSCCGDRWSRVRDDDGDEVPSVYGTPITDTVNNLWGLPSFVHYKDGNIKQFKED